MEDIKFDAPNWIYVGDIETCPHSKKQVGICKDLGLNLKGAVLCNDPEHSKSDACVKVPAFPSFCNLESNICVAGLRETMDQFKELQKMSDDELKKKKK